MRVLRTNENYLSLCGLFADREGESKAYRLLQRINYAILLFGNVYVLIITSGLYSYRNIDNMTNATNAFIVLTAGIAVFGGFVSYTFKKKTIRWLHNELQDIADQSQGNPIIFQHYAEAERRGRLYTKVISISGTTYISLGAFGMAIGHSLYSMFHGNMDSRTWYLPYRMALVSQFPAPGDTVDTIS